MRTSDRIFLWLLGMLNIAAAIYMIYCRYICDAFTIADILVGNNGLVSADVAVAFTALALIIVGTSLNLVAWNSLKYNQIKKNDVILISSDEFGTSYITFSAIRDITKRKCMLIRGIADCSTDVEYKKDTGIINVKVKIKPVVDTELTSVIPQLKQNLIDAVEVQTGLKVSMIDVLVLPSISSKNK